MPAFVPADRLENTEQRSGPKEEPAVWTLSLRLVRADAVEILALRLEQTVVALDIVFRNRLIRHAQKREQDASSEHPSGPFRSDNE